MFRHNKKIFHNVRNVYTIQGLRWIANALAVRMLPIRRLIVAEYVKSTFARIAR